MGQSLLTNQFITGLRFHLKRELIGVEGSFEEMVLKARFEEAKRQEFVTPRTTVLLKAQQSLSVPTPAMPTLPNNTFASTITTTSSGISFQNAKLSKKWMLCLRYGRIWLKNCPYLKSKQDQEAKGGQTGTPQNTMSALFMGRSR